VKGLETSSNPAHFLGSHTFDVCGDHLPDEHAQLIEPEPVAMYPGKQVGQQIVPEGEFGAHVEKSVEGKLAGGLTQGSATQDTALVLNTPREHVSVKAVVGVPIGRENPKAQRGVQNPSEGVINAQPATW
jgi:hypothetical protein